METQRGGFSRILTLSLLLISLALAGYAWYSGNRVTRLQQDLEKAITLAEQHRSIAERNAMGAVRAQSLAEEQLRVAMEHAESARQAIERCMTGKK